MSVETHEVLRKLPPVELFGALVTAIIDNQRGDPVNSVYTLIMMAEVMAKHLPLVDQVLASLAMHESSLELLPPRQQKPMGQKNGTRIELVK